MALSIATWNINSVRLRIELVLRFLQDQQPDVLCLQETKCPDEAFPLSAFKQAGYDHVMHHGEKGYNGVAIISKLPLSARETRSFCGRSDTRHISAGVGSLTIHNFYVPSGGDIADPEANPKFAHKLAFLAELEAFAAQGKTSRSGEIVVGDLNIAPLVSDVWSHKQLLDVVSHTPVETEALERIRALGGWTDAVRHHRPEPEKLYTWWSYRAADWNAANKGRRLDHIWTSADLSAAIHSVDIIRAARGWDKPSDHVPVMLRLKG